MHNQPTKPTKPSISMDFAIAAGLGAAGQYAVCVFSGKDMSKYTLMDYAWGAASGALAYAGAQYFVPAQSMTVKYGIAAAAGAAKGSMAY